jgi:diguanylate cyclase (GGDEF)-like protein
MHQRPPSPLLQDETVPRARQYARTRAFRATRWAGRPGVAGRLLIAVLLPLTVLGVAASVLLAERYHTAQEAKSIAREIPALTGVVRMRTLLDQERMAAEGTARIKELGIGLPTETGALGLTFAPQTAARTAVDEQLRSQRGVIPPSFASELLALRGQIDAGRLGARSIDQGFARLSNTLAGVIAQRVTGLEQHLAGTSQAAALTSALRTLGEANEVLEADATETADVSDAYLDVRADHDTDIRALGEQLALLDDASSRIDTNGAEPMRAELVALQGSPAWQQLQEAAATAPAGLSGAVSEHRGRVMLREGQPQVLQLIGVFAAGLSEIHKLYGFVYDAELSTRHVAAQLQASSTASYRDLLVEMLIGIGLTIVAVLLIARSISRPLHRLENHARAVSNGELELAPLSERGPRETRVASHAFNDLVSSLRLLEAKMRLLAECSFKDPLLAKPLPGRLGQALENSIAVLSGSIVERDALQHNLAHEATHDALTGLHNRAAAVEFLDRAIARSTRGGQGVAVLFIDLDDFKRANDTYGHAVGDAILKTIAERMAAAAREVDFVARLGGDEFVVIAECLTDSSDAATIAARLVDAAAAPLHLEGVQIAVGARVGVAFALDGGADDSSQLLARADLALYRAKHSNSRVEVYDESLQQALLERAQIEQDLTEALARGGEGLSLHFQPVIDGASGDLVAAEALVRWTRRDGERCTPDEFIPAAEASELIVQLDRWVLSAALAQQRTWREEGLADLRVAVNISGRHLLCGQLPSNVTQALRDSGADPGLLTLELTETVLLTDMPAVGIEMQRLRELGVRVSIDDFGTGFTSLAHLQHLTVDEIKIDRSYVQQLPDGRDSALVRLVTQAGHHLGVTIVAEGVETAEQLGALQEIGCDSLQGYRIARPLEADRFMAWAREHTSGLPAEPAATSLDAV